MNSTEGDERQAEEQVRSNEGCKWVVDEYCTREKVGGNEGERRGEESEIGN